MNCRFCGKENIFKFLELGMMALANSFLTEDELQSLEEPVYPLDIFFCDKCGLVQIGCVVSPDALFKEYIYFSATSDLVHKHADYLAGNFQERFKLNKDSHVVEIASNDGTVLHYFKKTGVNVLGVEPASNIAKVALEAGIETFNDFFNEATATEIKEKYGLADIILARHVFAHIPEIHGFVKGLKQLLAPQGVLAIEAPYLIDFVEKNEFDTIYHEHYSYLSVRAMSYLFNLYGMEVFDLERVPIHGGSIIFFIGNKGKHTVSDIVEESVTAEIAKGLNKKTTYIEFAKRTVLIKEDLLKLLMEIKSSGKRTAAYGAPAKGNTLLNFCGIDNKLIGYTVDKSPYKQNLFTPGAHLPIFHPDKLIQDMPDFVLLLAWNFENEILDQQKSYRDKGGKFIVPIPGVRVIE